MKKSLSSLLLLFSIVLCSYTNASASQMGELGRLGELGISRPINGGGYEYYDANGNIIGSSRRITGGGYEYYDANGNLLYVDRPITGGGWQRTSR